MSHSPDVGFQMPRFLDVPISRFSGCLDVPISRCSYALRPLPPLRSMILLFPITRSRRSPDVPISRFPDAPMFRCPAFPMSLHFATIAPFAVNDFAFPDHQITGISRCPDFPMSRFPDAYTLRPLRPLRSMILLFPITRSRGSLDVPISRCSDVRFPDALPPPYLIPVIPIWRRFVSIIASRTHCHHLRNFLLHAFLLHVFLVCIFRAEPFQSAFLPIGPR